MGNVSSNDLRDQEINVLRERIRLLKCEIDVYQKRLAGAERDIVALTKVAKDNSAALLNISLLEEGRSVYSRRPRRHAGSSYN